MPSLPKYSLVGQVLDEQFEIVRLLGAGGMGEVYLALHRQVNLPRAVKVLRAEVGDTVMIEKRLTREALVLRELQHENIVRVIQLARIESGDLYLAMEYLEGPTIQELVDTDGPLEQRDALTVLTQISKALAYAHAKGIVHRDLKPENVILQDGAVQAVKMFDFGLAKILSADGQTKLTQDSHLLGTPAYMSPEQCETANITGAADVYALGGIAYFLLSGCPPFSANSVTAYILAHSTTPPEPIDNRCPNAGISPALRNLLLSCLAKHPGDRPRADELESRLERILWETPRQRGKGSPMVASRTPRSAVASCGGAGQDGAGVNSGEAMAKTVGLGDEPGSVVDSPPESTAVDTVHSVAQMIWVDQAERYGHLSRMSAEWAQQEGLCNQISTATRELAQDILEEPGAPAALGSHLDILGHIEARLTDVEVDLALAESQIDEIRGQEEQISGMQAIQANHRMLLGQSNQLRRQINRCYRESYALLIEYRPQVSDPELLTYYREIEELVARYMRWAGLPKS